MSVALGGTYDSIGMIKDGWSGAISEMSSVTGRGAGTIREFITQMSIAGVDSQEVISSAFEGIAGAAYVTGNDINSMTYAMQRAVRTGLLNQRTLTALGISTQDIMGITGKSIEQVSDEFENMDATSRAAFLGMIYNAKYGTTANEAFKQSWQGVSEALGRAKDYLMIVLGQLLLPVLIPAMETLTGLLKWLANSISGLDPVSKGLLTGVLALAGGFVLLVGTLGSLKFILDTLKISWALNLLGINTSTLAADYHILATNAQILAQRLLNRELWVSAANYAKEIVVKGAAVALTAAQTAATMAATAAQWLWNAAMAANPIGLVVIAVAALVAGLYLLYQNNELVRNSINNLWTSIVGFGEYLQTSFINAFANMQSPFIQLADQIIGFGEDLYNAGKEWINNLLKGMRDAIPSIDSVLQQVADYFPHSPAKTGPLSEVTPDGMNSYGTELGTNLGEGVKDGTVTSLSDKEFWDIALSGLGGPLSTFKTISSVYGSKEATNDLVQAEQKRQEAVKKTFDDLENLDKKTKATFWSISDSSLTNAEKISYNMQVAAHNIAANFELAAERAEAAMSRMSSMASAMGIELPKTTYSPAELLSQRNETLRSLRAQRNAITQAGPSAYGSTREYKNALKDVDNQIKQYSSNAYLQSIMNSGSSIGQSWTAGISSGITSNTDEINAAIAQASNGLIAHSPPETGPLSEVDKFGMSIGETFTDYLSRGLSSVKELFNFNMGAASVPTPSATQLNPIGGGGFNFFFGDVKVPAGSDPVEVGRGLAEGAYSTFAERISRQGAARGTVIPNILR
jgi:hypothetical protein